MFTILLAVLALGLWAAVATFVAVLGSSQHREDRRVANGCLRQLIRNADMHGREAGSAAREVAARYNPALLNVRNRTQFRSGSWAQNSGDDPTVDLSGINTEGEQWLHRRR